MDPVPASTATDPLDGADGHAPEGLIGSLGDEVGTARPATWWGRRSRRGRAGIVAFALAMLIGNGVRVPYYSIGPGPATEVAPILSIEGLPSYPSSGSLFLTTALLSSRTLTLFEYLWALGDPNLETIPERFLIPPGSNDALQAAENLRAMETSKLQAERAAFLALGYDVPRIPAARVLGAVPGSPADTLIERGDLIVAVGPTRTSGAQEVVEAIRSRPPGQPVAITLRRDGASERVAVTPTRGADGVASIGVNIIDAYRFPAKVMIDTARIGGPSAGLVFALSLIEALAPDDLTRGRKIAVTGTISFVDGVAHVGPIGAIEEKVRGAVAAGAEIFVVPAGDGERAKAAAPPGLTILPVATLEDAVRALRAP